MRGALLVLAGCAHELPPEQACLEIGYAVAARTEACTGEVDLAIARQEAFEADYVCALPDLVDPAQERDLFGCALTLRNLACEVVVDYGDDLDLWLTASPVCDSLVESDMIALLTSVAAASSPFASCDLHAPVGGTAGFENALAAVRTNATTYGAANFARNRLQAYNTFAWDMHEVFGAAMVPSWCADTEGRISNELYAQPVDLFATNLGFRVPILDDGPANSHFELYYASSVTQSGSGSRGLSWSMPLFNAYPAISAPFLGRTFAGRGVSVYTVDWIGGATLASDIVSLQLGYTGTRGIYLDVSQEKVALFFNTIFGDGLQLSDTKYLLGGVDEFDPTQLGAENEDIGLTSLFYRDLPQASAPEEEEPEPEERGPRRNAFERLKTGHFRQLDMWGRLDVRAAWQFGPQARVRELAAAFHSEDWIPRDTSITEGAFYVRAGMVNLPDQPTLGVVGGVRPTLRADYRIQNEDALGARLSVRMNDPELLDLYPFAYNALGVNVELTYAWED